MKRESVVYLKKYIREPKRHLSELGEKNGIAKICEVRRSFSRADHMLRSVTSMVTPNKIL